MSAVEVFPAQVVQQAAGTAAATVKARPAVAVVAHLMCAKLALQLQTE
jgi:hypothetical protein